MLMAENKVKLRSRGCGEINIHSSCHGQLIDLKINMIGCVIVSILHGNLLSGLVCFYQLQVVSSAHQSAMAAMSSLHASFRSSNMNSLFGSEILWLFILTLYVYAELSLCFGVIPTGLTFYVFTLHMSAALDSLCYTPHLIITLLLFWRVE